MVGAKNQLHLAEFIERVWNNEEVDAVEQYVAPRYVIFHDPGDPWDGQTLNLAEFKARLVQSRSAAPDQTFKCEEMVGAGDKVAMAWTWKGTHIGDIAGIPATGRPIRMSGLTIYYFKKTYASWSLANRRSFRRLSTDFKLRWPQFA